MTCNSIHSNLTIFSTVSARFQMFIIINCSSIEIAAIVYLRSWCVTVTAIDCCVVQEFLIIGCLKNNVICLYGEFRNDWRIGRNGIIRKMVSDSQFWNSSKAYAWLKFESIKEWRHYNLNGSCSVVIGAKSSTAVYCREKKNGAGCYKNLWQFFVWNIFFNTSWINFERAHGVFEFCLFCFSHFFHPPYDAGVKNRPRGRGVERMVKILQ